MSIKLTVEPAPFKDAVEICERIASRADDINHRVARVSVGNGRLTISATDKSRFYERRMPVQGRNCSFCIEIGALSRVAKTASAADPIEISVGETLATFSFVGDFGKGTARAAIMPADHFSKFPEVPENPFVMDRSQLLGMLRAVLPCADRQNAREYLNGITLAVEPHGGEESGGKDLVFYACNANAVASCRTPVPMGCDFGRVIIPTEAVDQFELLCRQDDTLGIAVSENLIAVTGLGFTFMSRLIGSEPPQFLAMVPAAEGAVIEVDGAVLSSAVKSVMSWASERERCVWLVPSGDTVRVCCRGEGAAISTATVPAAISDDAEEITVAARTLAAALASGSGTFVVWGQPKGSEKAPPGYRYSRPDSPSGELFGAVARMRSQPWAAYEESAPVDDVTTQAAE